MTVTKEQAELIRRALESYSRMKMGQFGNVLRDAFPDLTWDDTQELGNIVKAKVYPELAYNGYYGVGTLKIPEISDCFDMVQVIRHRLSWDRLADEGRDKPEFYGVHYNEPMKFGQYPLISIKRSE